MEENLNVVALFGNKLGYSGVPCQLLTKTVVAMTQMFNVDIDSVCLRDAEFSFRIISGEIVFEPELNKADIPLFCVLMLTVIFKTEEKEATNNGTVQE